MSEKTRVQSASVLWTVKTQWIKRSTPESSEAWATLLLIVVSIGLLLPGPLLAEDNVQGSVAKILVTRRLPDWQRPWMKREPQEASGSGVVIEGDRILTNAHLVTYAKSIYVQPHKSADKLTARVAALAPGVDLALLELDDGSFFDTHPALPLGAGLPQIKDTVNVYGYPVGGTEQSITEGIVSRIEYVPVNDDVSILRIQIDAALNPGNSGGPAVINDKIAGLVFKTLNLSSGKDKKRAENIGYMISVEEIQMFLADVEDGSYEGKPWIQGVHFQLCENEALRDWIGLEKEVSGLLVSRVHGGVSDYPLMPGDFITHIGPHPIDDEGKIHVHDGLRLPAFYMVPHLIDEGHVGVTVLRNGTGREIKVPVDIRSRRLIRGELSRYPSYFIYGPMVFTTVTHNFMGTMPRHFRSPLLGGSPVSARSTDLVAFEGEELVALVPPMFPHPIMKGYNARLAYGVVSHVNGEEIGNLRHLVETIRDTGDEYATIRFSNIGMGLRYRNIEDETVVFRRDELESATQDILEDNGIRYQLSKDLRSVWRPPDERVRD